MMRKPIALLLCSLAACATYRPALIKTEAADYRLTPKSAGQPLEPWGIEALPSGELLSDDWKLQQRSGKDPQHVLLLYKQVREDGVLTLTVDPLTDEDAKKSVATLTDRLLNGVRIGAKNLALGTEKPLESIAVDGAEAQEAVYSLRRAGDTAPIRRIYLAVVKPFRQQQWMAIVFASAPGQFEASVEEVHSFVHRLHFDSNGVPMSPGTGAPLPLQKPDAPAEPQPKTPHHTPEGVALPG